MYTRPRILLLSALVALLTAGIVAPSQAAGRPGHADARPTTLGSERVPGTLLVRFAAHATPHHVRLVERSIGAREIGRIDALNVRVLHVAARRSDKATTRLEHVASVRYVEPDYTAEAADVIPNDPYFPWSGSNVIYGGQWGDGLTRAPRAWGTTTDRNR